MSRLAKEDEEGYRIYIKDGVPLNTQRQGGLRCYVGVDSGQAQGCQEKDEASVDEKAAGLYVLTISMTSVPSAR